MNSQFFQQLQSWPMFRNARPPRSGFTLSAVVVGLLLLLPVVSQCQYQYTTNNSTITITGYTGSGGAVTIPSTINNLPVTSIGEYAFSNAVSLTSLMIGTNVTSIGGFAFFYCTSLTSVTIPDSVTSIGDFAFAGANLTSVTIPASVTSIGEDPFGGSSLTTINVDVSNPAYSSVAGVLFNRSQTSLIEFPEGTFGSYTIPNGVLSINDWAFEDSGLTSVTIPESVSSIGVAAFNQCFNLTSIEIPAAVTNIGDSAFDLCYKMTSLTIADGVPSIGYNAFAYCSGLTSVTIPASVTNIGDSAFAGCASLTQVYFKGNAPSLGGGAVFHDDTATVYYLLGSTGFGATYGGVPATLWSGQSPGQPVLESIFQEDFPGNVVDYAKWHIPTWVSPTDGTYVGRTQFECTQNAGLPAAEDGNALITVQTFNPTGASFYGYDLISDPMFTPGPSGLTVTIVAKLGTSTPGGTVSGFFMYSLKPGGGTLHDEIDFELLSNDVTNFNTNIYGDEPLGVGHPAAYPYTSGLATDYHTYQFQWYTNEVTWAVDGTVVRTVTTQSPVPVGPMYLHLNMWAPDSTYPAGYNPGLTYTTDPNDNQVWTTYVSSVKVQQLQVPVLTTIDVSPLTVSLNVSGTQVLTATPIDQGGNSFDVIVTWASDNPGVATVDPATGMVTGISDGTADITAISDGVTSSPSVVTVSTSVSVPTPTNATPDIQFTSLPQYGAFGEVKGVVTRLKPLPASDFGVLVFINVNGSWWIKPYDDAPVTTINSKGNWAANIVTGGDDTEATEIRAYLVPAGFSTLSMSSSLSQYPYADIVRLPAPTGLKKVTVVPKSATLTVGGGSVSFTATGLNKEKQPVDATFLWLSANPAVATVDQNGNVLPVSRGSTSIHAISGHVTGTATVKVTSQ